MIVDSDIFFYVSVNDLKKKKAIASVLKEYFGGTGSTGGGDILLATTYNKDSTGGILFCSQYNP